MGASSFFCLPKSASHVTRIFLKMDPKEQKVRTKTWWEEKVGTKIWWGSYFKLSLRELCGRFEASSFYLEVV